MGKTQQLGKKAEEFACQYLLNHGLKLVDRNYQCRVGEIDLIMQDEKYLIFIEVRYRQNIYFGNGVESVTNTKQKKLIKTASYYLQQKKLDEKINCRFDVVSLSLKKLTPELEWIKNAFST